MPLDQQRTRALVAAIFTGPSAKAGARLLGYRIEAVFALLAARENPGGVQLARGAAAIGFAALAAPQIERALDQGSRTLKRSQRLGHSAKGTPQLLAEFGEVVAQSVSLILYTYTDCKRQNVARSENPRQTYPKGKIRRFYEGLRSPSPLSELQRARCQGIRELAQYAEAGLR